MKKIYKKSIYDDVDEKLHNIDFDEDYDLRRVLTDLLNYMGKGYISTSTGLTDLSINQKDFGAIMKSLEYQGFDYDPAKVIKILEGEFQVRVANNKMKNKYAYTDDERLINFIGYFIKENRIVGKFRVKEMLDLLESLESWGVDYSDEEEIIDLLNYYYPKHEYVGGVEDKYNDIFEPAYARKNKRNKLAFNTYDTDSMFDDKERENFYTPSEIDQSYTWDEIDDDYKEDEEDLVSDGRKTVDYNIADEYTENLINAVSKMKESKQMIDNAIKIISKNGKDNETFKLYGEESYQDLIRSTIILDQITADVNWAWQS